jgi:DNA-binding response OmpR family regulator
MKLLLVEDDEIITELLVEALDAQNYEVDVAHDGLKAWKSLSSVDYDLLLLDLTMPEVDGLTLCRRLRADGYQMPVIMLTARDSLEDRVAGLEAGADDYVVKPYRVPELLVRIQSLLDSRAGDRRIKKWDCSLTAGKCSEKWAWAN